MPGKKPPACLTSLEQTLRAWKQIVFAREHRAQCSGRSRHKDVLVSQIHLFSSAFVARARAWLGKTCLRACAHWLQKSWPGDYFFSFGPARLVCRFTADTWTSKSAKSICFHAAFVACARAWQGKTCLRACAHWLRKSWPGDYFFSSGPARLVCRLTADTWTS